jgi:predicted XRE-type DNA-binding protein
VTRLFHARKDADFNGGKREAGDIALWLNKLGMSHAEIATILSSTTNSVGVMLHKKRRAAKKSKKK